MIESPDLSERGISKLSAAIYTNGRWLVPFTCVWLFLVVAGFWGLMFYENSPGPPSSAAVSWPVQSCLKQTPSQFTLIMAVHPKCPCTNASLSELALLMTRCNRLNAYLLFVRPSGFPEDWEKTNNWRRAAALPRVQVVTDDGGKEAEKFGMRTSGEIALYGPSGKLMFSGGITGSRGHEGDNQGLDSVESIVVNAGSTGCSKTTVFGCSLLDDGAPPPQSIQRWVQ